MRITGGAWRSRRLRGPGRSSPLRPTPDALRERAFAVLGDRVRDAVFLDLYAGTGAVGFEALSRGAREVVFVESHRAAIALIEINRTGLAVAAELAEVVHRPALAAVEALGRRGRVFDLAWADPPFELWREGADVLVRAFHLGVLTTTATACLECPAGADVEPAAAPLVVTRDLAGGASRLVLLATPTA